MNLIIITPEIAYPNEIELIHGFFTNGLLKLHLRKPHFTFTDYRSFLFQIDKKFHHQISIHDNFSLLKSFPDLGIHLTGKLREEGNYQEKISMINPSTSSTSFHSWKEIEDNLYPFDYAFISPVFDSISKKGYKAAIDLSEANRVKKKLIERKGKYPSIIALGGIDDTNIELLYKNGFDGAAILGAVWESKDPFASFLQIKEIIKRFTDV